jgi:hypothetical protein
MRDTTPRSPLSRSLSPPLLARSLISCGCGVIDFDGREVKYGFGGLDELVLGYATTIH